ncbi:hypothetical protein CHL76_14825 [Marinococcus halophilus]|nr:hypothetical protein CHL76_14825 [Marinococcus halophilus]
MPPVSAGLEGLLMPDVYFIRHGESEGNYAQVLQGSMDYPLTRHGQTQAEALGSYFREVQFDAVIASDLMRASGTAAALADFQQVDISTDERLREVHLGVLEGKAREVIQNEFPDLIGRDLLTAEVEGAETKNDLTARCAWLYHKLTEEWKEKDQVAVVSHGGFITIFFMYLLAKDNWVSLQRSMRIDNTGVSRIHFRKDRASIQYINRITHLE